MPKGAMAELVVGDAALLSTEVGPVIDEDARRMLEQHKARMAREATLIHEVPLPKGTAHGCFVAPAAYEIAGIQVLEREVFGPILHVVRYRADRLDQRSEEHTSELQSLMRISYAVFCLKKKKKIT